MNLKKFATDQLKKAAVKEATNKILPMDSVKPKAGLKGKMTLGALVLAIGGLLFEYLS
jgi:hypothetical protein